VKDPLKTATTLVGLLAGLVVGVYLLGGLVIALRLLFDDYDFNAVVVVLGQLPREPVIATALLDVIGPAVAFGLLVALFYGARDRPKPRPWGGDELDEGPGAFALRAFFFPLVAAALCAWAILQALSTDHFSLLLLLGSGLGIAVTWAVLAAVWFMKRRVARTTLSRLPRAAAAGGLFALVALTPAVMTASAYPFEQAIVCTTESQVPQRGQLIGEGGGRILIEQSADGEADVVSVPTEHAGRTEFGDVERLPCPLPASQVAAASEAEAALGGHGSKQEVELAMQVRPYLLFDSEEHWRPLEIESFLRERFPRQEAGAQRLCYAVKPCEAAHGAEKLQPVLGAPTFIDIAGGLENGKDFHSPHPRCRKDKPAVDCNSGPLSAMYYRRSTHEGRWYWDFWVFYRYNDYTATASECIKERWCSDHEGDWEGVTVVTSPSLTPELLGVIYAAHRNRILVEAEDLPSLEGHPVAYVAEGTHASYPYRCAKDCHQYAKKAGVFLPEDDHDGKVPWGGNSEQDCATYQCVRPFPEVGEPGGLAPPLAGGWAAWPGAWGATCQRNECRKKIAEVQGSPASPGTQPRFRCPWAPTDESPRLSDKGGLTESERAAGAARRYATCARQAGVGP
jgi:hypothetical protein